VMETAGGCYIIHRPLVSTLPARLCHRVFSVGFAFAFGWAWACVCVCGHLCVFTTTPLLLPPNTLPLCLLYDR